jgi:cytochrome c553
MRHSMRYAQPLLAAVSLLLAAAAARAQSSPIAGRPLAEQLVACEACHGEGGISTAPNVPTLAGQQPLFITNQLILFREGLRKSELMSPFAAGLKDEEIVRLADALAKLPIALSAIDAAAAAVNAPPVVPDPQRQKRGAALVMALRCTSCHLPTLRGRDQIPRVAGQREDYLGQSMRQYRDNLRVGSDTSMAEAMYGVSDADVDALAHFLATLP